MVAIRLAKVVVVHVVAIVIEHVRAIASLDVEVLVQELALQHVAVLAPEDAKEDAVEIAKATVPELVVVDAATVALVVVLVELFLYNIGHKMNKIKENTQPWQGGIAKNITFIVTKDCQLACKYCYLVGKNSKERMPWEIAKQAIDYILANEKDFLEESVVWDFIGGEPFLEIDLIDKICDYLKKEMFRLNHHWFNSYRFSFSTNGINYDSPKVQRFIEKNRTHLSIGITIDGTEQKHDLNRIYKGEVERGSYKDVVRNLPLLLSQFPGAGTKVTISSADIPYIKESVLHLFSLGIHEVNINCVFEDVWNEGDDKLFEQQLFELADEIIDNNLYEENACSFFTELMGKPLDCVTQNQNWCGAGKMLAIDAAGNFYPCTRFAQYSLREKKAWIIGNVKDGIDKNLLRPFLLLDRCTQSTQECIDCEVAEGCAWCQGENYDAAETPTIYQRSTAICKMHKARVRANNYYWNKLFNKLEREGKADSLTMPDIIR